jgi:hypothetical protein
VDQSESANAPRWTNEQAPLIRRARNTHQAETGSTDTSLQCCQRTSFYKVWSVLTKLELPYTCYWESLKQKTTSFFWFFLPFFGRNFPIPIKADLATLRIEQDSKNISSETSWLRTEKVLIARERKNISSLEAATSTTLPRSRRRDSITREVTHHRIRREQQQDG